MINANEILIRKYKMFMKLRKMHKKNFKKFKKIPQGNFDIQQFKKNKKKEQKLTIKYNNKIQHMRKQIYYDPNTFEIDLF